MDDDEFLSDGESTNGESEDDLPNDSEEKPLILSMMARY
jgi:hypothetical protein